MNNTEKKIASWGKIVLIGAGSLMVVFLAYHTVMCALAPSRKLDEINSKIVSQTDEKKEMDERYYSDSAYISLLREKSFLQARVSMAETDSVYMTINLEDSIANLSISGVEVHSAKISKMKVSRMLRSGNEYLISSYFSAPMNIVNDISSIKKEPLMIKMAPKDTSEFKPDVIPDTSDYEPVNYIFQMDNGLRLFVYQETDTITKDKNQLFYFDLSIRLRNTLGSLKSTLRFKVPEYYPFIKIRLKKADAKILYRAIPRQGQVAVYM